VISPQPGQGDAETVAKAGFSSWHLWRRVPLQELGCEVAGEVFFLEFVIM
jgi:hypothetical protein